MTRNQFFSLFGFGNYPGIALPEADGALDSIGELQQLIGLYALGAEAAAAPTPAPTPTPETGDEDVHSWFEVAPGIMPIGAQTALRGQLLKSLPAVRARWKVTLLRPARRTVRPVQPQPVQIIVPAEMVPTPPSPLYGVGRAFLPQITGRGEGWAEDIDDIVLLILAAEMDPEPPRRYLVQRSVVEAEMQDKLQTMLARLS